MDKVKKHRRFRVIIQLVWTALTNGYLYGFVKGRIYTGRLKDACVPGLNCYSCPGAYGSCPIGSLQASLAGPVSRPAFYCLGILIFFGSLFGRFICGWLCPFGLVQDLLYKIPAAKKRKNMPGHKLLKNLKYIVLALMVIILPIIITDSSGVGKLWFCEYICPSGTLFGGIPLTVSDSGLRAAIGAGFWWKIIVLLLIILSSVWTYRPFCKYLCPLGAFYSIFNKVSLYHYSVNDRLCTGCGVCEKVCRMGINPMLDPNSPECIRCGECLKECPDNALSRVSLRRGAGIMKLLVVVVIASSVTACGSPDNKPHTDPGRYDDVENTPDITGSEDKTTVENVDVNNNVYTYICRDEKGNGVSGVRISVCSDDNCMMITSDDNGIAEYAGEPAEYEVHILSYPDNYELISDAEFRTDGVYGEYRIEFNEKH